MTDCIASPSQSLSEDTPFAYLTGHIQYGFVGRKSIDIYISDKRLPSTKAIDRSHSHTRDDRLPGENEILLFLIKNAAANPPSEYIRVPAEKRIFIRYFEIASDGHICFQ